MGALSCCVKLRDAGHRPLARRKLEVSCLNDSRRDGARNRPARLFNPNPEETQRASDQKQRHVGACPELPIAVGWYRCGRFDNAQF